MSKSGDRIGEVSHFMQLLAHRPISRYLESEGLLTGGFYWRIKARLARRNIARNTKDLYEAGGNEFEAEYESWQDLVYRAKFGESLSELGRKTTRKLVDDGIAEAKIRMWIVNKHMDVDGVLRPYYRGWVDTIVNCLGWIWHTLVVLTFTIFTAFAWSLPGLLWKKLLVTIGLVAFFLLMSVLMNSTSLSALPPTKKSVELLNK